MNKKSKTENIGDLTFEQAIKALNDIVSRIEAGQTPLETSLAQYEQGMALIKHCRTILTKAQERIEIISAGQNEGTQGKKNACRNSKAANNSADMFDKNTRHSHAEEDDMETDKEDNANGEEGEDDKD